MPVQLTVLFLDHSLPTAEQNLAYDQALLQRAESDGRAEYLRVWESAEYAVVLGKNCQAQDDVCIESCLADQVPVLQRFSGGGTVLIGPGCLNYTVVLRYDREPGLQSVTRSFAYCLVPLQAALKGLGIESELMGSDLMWRGRKFGGSAQRRQQTHFLHHGTILYHFDLPRVTRYLRQPQRQPPHRANRDHDSFLTCIRAERDAIAGSLGRSWNARTP